jgi:hypothetical protein
MSHPHRWHPLGGRRLGGLLVITEVRDDHIRPVEQDSGRLSVNVDPVEVVVIACEEIADGIDVMATFHETPEEFVG